MKRGWPVLLVGAASCTLLTNFDPNSQPCDPTGACLTGFTCVAGICVDGGVGGSGGGGGTGGGTAGGGGTGGGTGCACTATQLCVNGSCLERNCGSTTCATGAVCSGGGCVPVQCVGNGCAANQVCNAAGGCQPISCGATTCSGGKACVIDAGTLHCLDVACTGLSCAAGTRCANGACIACDTTETVCNDGVDNDCDGTTDCADSDCTAGIALCDDGNPCTSGERCAAGGGCSGGAVATCTTPPSPCVADAGTCSLASGGCFYTPKPDATACGALPKSRCCTGACVDISTDARNCGGCGLTCSAGTTCSTVSNTLSCFNRPADTTGRCGCSSGTCPANQTCLNSTLAGGSYCSPQDAGQCAPKGLVSIAIDGCPNFCSY